MTPNYEPFQMVRKGDVTFAQWRHEYAPMILSHEEVRRAGGRGQSFNVQFQQVEG